jgi:OFA family oxalate/formate antiporter-like MFS transporter
VGSEIDVIAYLTARYFGLKQYSRIYGTFYATFGVAAFLGPYPAAWISTHNPAGYMPVLWAAMALIAAGIGLLLMFKRYPRVAPA